MKIILERFSVFFQPPVGEAQQIMKPKLKSFFIKIQKF
jgi:hypothetical protein